MVPEGRRRARPHAGAGRLALHGGATLEERTIFINTGSEPATEVARAAGWPRPSYTDGYEFLVLGGSAWLARRSTGGASAVSIGETTARGFGRPPPGVFVIPEPNAYRPYVTGATEEEAALANLDIALKMFDMQSAGRGAAIPAEPVISASGVLVPPALQCGHCARRPTTAAAADLRRG